MPRLLSRNDFGDIRNDLLQMLNELEHIFESNLSKKRNPIIEQAERYVKSRYAEELSLQILASRLNVNNIYLGRLFKEETGVYFSDYLNYIRLERAKELLASTLMKVSDIAGQIGFVDSNYFFRKFKQDTGLSPTEYRNLHTKE
ncbi:helix-turn-helix transcriptional regulator [Paenibacillus aceris]|uniref:YesN/AraC family two-component response regulator n=1 Tax=Paenibacillus aceris TaxID=869555 RepID=A0ABS4I341_9BACL|nr:helix-turn-helix domain-containing protein [Paenibacillus aceris]MBP1965341.1 YesN/AraC family two-component response regulator [Paenibacillus aceris]NHW36021.1 helix-turn-helix domain-containing protein [Paenibacillus aceris]